MNRIGAPNRPAKSCDQGYPGLVSNTTSSASMQKIKRQRPCLNSRRRRHITKKLLLRDGDLCHYCKIKMIPFQDERTDTTITREHVVPLCYGGGSTQDNMVLCCNACNNERGDILHYCDCAFCITAYSLYFKE